MSKILVVDDFAYTRQYFVKLLSYGGHHMLQAQDGLEALEVTWAERPDVVICDLAMPIMDGFDYYRQLQAAPELRHILVIFTSAVFVPWEAVSRTAGCQGCAFMAKPVSPTEVLSTVGAALDSLALGPPTGGG